MFKTVAITGATGTMGRACVQRFCRADWAMLGCSQSGGRIFIRADDLHIDAVDVTDEEAVIGWLDRTHPINALVTCAGLSLVKPTIELTVAEWCRIVEVNLTGTFLCAREAIRRGATRIVTVGSIHGCTPTSYPQRAAYTASKAGVMGLTQALAVEFAPQGVAANCVAPGHLPALMSGTGLSGEQAAKGQALLDAARARTPAGRLVMPEEVAEVIFWLCNDAPLTLTGQTIVVDGGFVANTLPLSR